MFAHIACPMRLILVLMRFGITLWRILISHKRLLEWNPSDNPRRKRRNAMVNYFGAMWFAPAFAAVMAITIFFSHPHALAVAGPLLFIWLISPLIAYLSTGHLLTMKQNLRPTDCSSRKIYGKPWSFFETFVGPDDNWLPPDNFAERTRCRGRPSHVAD